MLWIPYLYEWIFIVYSEYLDHYKFEMNVPKRIQI
jgi:hypothetical protein